MNKLIKKISRKAGLAPGTLVHVGEKISEEIKISFMDYYGDDFRENFDTTVEKCLPLKESPNVSWINIEGLHDETVIKEIGEHFDIHPLVLEDILNTEQHPKIDIYDKYIFIVLKMITYDDFDNELDVEQVSILIGDNFVISFQEGRPGDVFDPVRHRIRDGKGKIRKMGPDYLAYALLDVIIDNYFIVLENFSMLIEDFEEKLMLAPDDDTLKDIYEMKREILVMRKAIWPLRDIVGKFDRTESKLVSDTTHIFLRDLYDHTIQVIDTVETFRDMATGMLELYLSSSSHRMNEVMKVLTIIATIFIPLTFIAGVYGMNFKYMPELEWKWGYFATWGVMIVVGVLLLIFFKRKKWI